MRRLWKHLACGFVVLVATIAMMETGALANPGDVLKMVNIPAAAQCTTGNALAVVSGGKAGFPKIPVLLVTSCVSGAQVNLSFLDPAAANAANGNTAALIKSFATIFPAAPPANSLPNAGWEALVLRADRGDLLACGTNTAAAKTVLWSVDFSPFNTTVDGTATFLRNGPTGSSCRAIAWDSSDKTFFQAPAAGASVFHFTEAGSVLTSIPSGCATPISGLGLSGTSLFAGCAATDTLPSAIQQLYKLDGTLVRSLAGPSANPAGLPDDPTTLVLQYKELLWSLDASLAQLLGVEIPGGTIGQLTGVPVLLPGIGSGANACPTGALDSDGDGLLDCWENGALWSDLRPGISYNGIYDGNVANRDVQLCVPVNSVNIAADCASPLLKDLFVEIDYMEFHQPDPVALAQVVNVFATAPTPPGPVRLHVQLDDQITHRSTMALVPCTIPAATGEADFDLLKAQFFGTAAERGTVNGRNAKALAFRYGMFAHNLTPGGNTTSGCSEIGGNDLVVSLGSWGSVNGHNVGTTDQQAGTFLHELGHTLGLRHGGGDNLNCKPNYPSVMNYSLQFSSPVGGRPLDYSREPLGVLLPSGVIGLDKTHLNETVGVGGTINFFTGKVVYGPVAQLAKPTVADGSGAINWNKSTTGAVDSNLSLDINQTTSSTGGCPANQGGVQGQILEGFNDWANMQFNFRGSLDFGDGARDGFEKNVDDDTNEMTLDTALALSRDVIDIKPDDKKNTIVASVTQTIGVTIFSRRSDDGTEVELFAPDIDPATVILRGTGGAVWAFPVKQNANGRFQCSTKDVNKDGLLDLVCNFVIPANTLSVIETRAVLEGTTLSGQPVHSADFIRVLP